MAGTLSQGQGDQGQARKENGPYLFLPYYGPIRSTWIRLGLAVGLATF